MELKSELLIENTQLASAQLLTEIAQNDDLISLLETAFGTDFSLENSTVLRQEWLSDNFLDDLKIIASRELDGALGAYAAANNTIYLSSEFLETGTPKEITAVFLEEYGHAIDARFNSIDSPGDEGAIFSALVRQETLSDHQLNALRAEDDNTEIVVNGEPILVEQANFTVTNLLDDGSSGSLREAITQANGNGEADTIMFDAGLSGTINLTSGEFAITEAVTITGSGADQLTIDAGGSSRVFNVDDGSEYSLTNVSISDVTITGGSAVADGAGIFNKENLVITNSVISGNTAFDSGGGIYNASPYSIESYGGTLTLVNSTISGNDASYRGGGIYNNNTATVTNSTIAQNYAGYRGGGLFNNGEALLNQATIAQNQISTSGVGEGIYNNANLALVNSIVAGHSDGDIYDSGTVITTGNNIVQDGSITGVITGDPLLDPAGLQNNGGSTPTIALQGGSPAINAGDDTVIPADILDEDGDSDTGEDIPFDQRGTGFDRVLNGTVDIGALEVPVPTLVVDILADENDGNFSVGDLSLREAIAEIDPGGIITFDSGLADGTIDLSTSGLGELVIDKSLTIDGESNNITIDGGNSSRIFNVDDGDVNSAIDVLISDVTITNGNSGDDGGGILNRENLTVSNSTISNSYATDIGGGVINYGEITLTNSTVSGNDAGIDGGGISNQSSGTATLTNSTISGNNATAGAGLINAGNLTLNFSTISGNNATNNGGGVYNYNSGDLTLNTSIISGNNATNSGGGMYNAATATLNSSTVSGNTADNDGGGLYVGSAYGVANLNNSTVSGNYAASFGGGLLISGGYDSYSNFYAATANVSNSTVYGNTADSGGGGLYNYGGAATITNSTIAGNSADSATSGGGLLTGSKYANNSTTTIESAIVADNNANGSPDDIQDSILVNASFSLIENGGFTDNGNNISATDPAFDPEGLKRNGGFVETIALQSTSPAIDVGSNPDSLLFDQRRKNFDREIDGDEDGTPEADMGAFEFQNGANTSPITVELRLFEDRGAGLVDVTSSGEIFTSNFEVEVLVADERGTPEGVVSTTYDLTYDSNLVDNGDDFSSITDTANSLLTSNFPVFRGGTLDNVAGTITDLGASAIEDGNPDNGEAIGVSAPEVLSTLSFSEVLSRSSSTFDFDLTIDPGQTGFADGVFADPSAINFSQNVTLNNAPELDPIISPDIAENAVATDIVLPGSDITATDDGLGNEVTFDLTPPTDGGGNPLFSFFDSSQSGDARFVSTSTATENFPVVVTPEGEAVLDFETTPSYNLGITASDGFKDSAETTVTVNVTDVQPSIGVSDTTITFGTPLSQFREGATDSDLVRPAFPDIFKSIVITNTLSGAIENNDALTITDFVINASNVSITSGNVPAGEDIILNPGESHRVDLQYAPTAAGESFDLANGFVINSDAGNNPALEVNLAGQSTFNSDVDYSGNESLGAVDLNDLAVLETLPFGSTVGDAGYDPTADINGDGNINRGEIVVLNGELFQSL